MRKLERNGQVLFASNILEIYNMSFFNWFFGFLIGVAVCVILLIMFLNEDIDLLYNFLFMIIIVIVLISISPYYHKWYLDTHYKN